MKVPLSDQIEEARLHRDALEKAVADKPHLLERLHRSEALLLTVTAYAAFETDIRQTAQERNT